MKKQAFVTLFLTFILFPPQSQSLEKSGLIFFSKGFTKSPPCYLAGINFLLNFSSRKSLTEDKFVVVDVKGNRCVRDSRILFYSNKSSNREKKRKE